jgi:ClpP class serine protease
MPSWSSILDQVQALSNEGAELNKIRSKYLADISSITGRNAISYYSCWLKTPGAPNSSINDQDMNAFMNAVHGLDKNKGLDLLLHTPGGDLAATESIINYLRTIFSDDIRAIIPQISMSAGTIIAISCKEIMMGKQSSLGPIDPQLGGVACQSVLEEFDTAVKEISKNPASAALWQVIFNKYTPTFITACKKAIEWSEKLMLDYIQNTYGSSFKVSPVKDLFLNNKNSYSHNRHISKSACKNVGLNVTDLEEKQDLQEAVLSLHHTYMILFDKFNISKVVENQKGSCFVQQFNPNQLIRK